MSSGNWL